MNSRIATLSRYPLVLSALFALAACNKTETAAPADAAATPAAGEAAAPAATPAAGETPAPAPAPEEPAITPAATVTPPAGPAPVAGTDYIEIPAGQAFDPVPGKIEVAEVFSYTCPHCAQFEPLLVDWRKKQTADVKFTPIAGPFGGNPIPFEKAFYAAQTLGLVEKTHEAMFRAVHIDQSIPYMSVTDEQLGAFYAKYGVKPADFIGTMNSFAINAKGKRAEQFMQRSGVDSSPSLVVNGKYLVKGKNFEDYLRIADHLVARERATLQATAPAAAPAAAAPAPAAETAPKQ
ncbi:MULTISPECIES: thiol:disulfide interchange protein DsbA/DsbL [Lysobacter]|jgi:thiol:disulfide interchange protein DsbA|uniref:Thiol:disulfide interchange protein DsbA/DsbL n=2 Tax=Lysobacter gummosus TaxID=262324 RepID=A0ABY3XEL1_9GAMM|nr:MULTISPECIES: thiol:disulfide interchange protein DsbA/DsbL [Lysobacter]ALN89504.1 disulfide oxidoreductase domain protein [Lysobacter gummosus]UJB18583.1 thiol:disulfide interchange protein DsbA/DsbL [Lysobacter capsici]UJQ27692.1 thiol:disulfide interchange protein DsbA/DsbL [Lysobacter gummosus]UNP30147.1 thiol:disulfide interchange protein DsbA/DsbL [Lysobacter gummosus]